MSDTSTGTGKVVAVAAPSGTPGLNAAGYLSPMMLKTRTTTTMSTITPPMMIIRVPSALNGC